MNCSADPDARWVNKGSNSTLGYTAFARADEAGFIDKVSATPTNCAESQESGGMIEGGSADASKANRERLRGKHRDGILRKAARHRPLRASEKRVNKRISKRLFGLPRDRDFGQAKPHVQLAMVAIGQNLLKAANKITFNPQTPAIA